MSRKRICCLRRYAIVAVLLVTADGNKADLLFAVPTVDGLGDVLDQLSASHAIEARGMGG